MSVSIEGERITGEAVRSQNAMAVQAVANSVRSSLGPVGLDKMLVDDVGEVTITNDGATVLRLMDTEHPAAKILCDLARVQDREVGDGTTSVVVLAAELVKVACELCKSGLHPTAAIAGFRLAAREAVRFIADKIAVSSTKLTHDYLINIAKTSLNSKIIGAHSNYFAKLIVEAAQSVAHVDKNKEYVSASGSGSSGTKESGKDKIKCDINKIKIVKAHGGKMTDTTFIKGFALNCTVASESCPKRISPAKIALLDFGLQKAKMALGIQVVVNDPEKLTAIRDEEVEMVMRRIRLVLAAGANVVLCSGGIDDLCLKPFSEHACMAVRRVTRGDLTKIAQMTEGVVCTTLANIEGGESFDASNLGRADSVEQRFVGDNELIVIEGACTNFGGSFLIRGANDYLCEEVERSIHDALCAVQLVLESKTVVPGGGAVEAALSVHLENFACGISTNEQLSIAEYANALLVIPKTLAVNAALDASDCVATLRARHAKSYSNHNNDIYSGLDLMTGNVVNNLQAGVLEPTLSKIKMLKFATEAAITILRIDDMIKLAPEQKDPRQEDQCH